MTFDAFDKPRAECRHEKIMFGSGDYYIFCYSCEARWVCCSNLEDHPSPNLANQGEGVGLSGQLRHAIGSL